MKKNSLQEWLDYWLTAHGDNEIELGLDRVNQVKNQMDWQIDRPIITVGGTNGKGSVCAFLTAIYTQAGYRVGTLTSPHLLRYNERIAINGEPVTDEKIIRAFERIENKRATISLTYFEVNVLAAVDVFLQEKVDIIILEVGLGGRLDAVNIFDADVAVLTNVDLDHQEYLGDTREKIAYEKAGIYRPEKPAIVGEIDPANALLEYITEINAIGLRLGVDYSYERLGHQWNFHFKPSHQQHAKEHRRFALPIPALRGSYQLDNASSALCAIECLHSKMPVDTGSIKKGLLLVSHPARFQILPGRPIVVLDVGHNPHAARELKNNFLHLPFAKKKIAIFSMLADKDIDTVLDILKDEFDAWYIATLNTNRALSCAKIEEKLLQHGVQKIKTFNSIAKAYHSALKEISEDDRIVVFGSFFTVAEVMASFNTQRN
ncbi:bifunctional tetrahydrofolate synthase/dihydrofolate synthase [Neisseriaceae bacterium PsAf]|nr:bifunctional tetrahydrofolate synthase/dihydrofolate synthase [Neisseriaceae bacterium PsAf]